MRLVERGQVGLEVGALEGVVVHHALHDVLAQQGVEGRVVEGRRAGGPERQGGQAGQRGARRPWRTGHLQDAKRTSPSTRRARGLDSDGRSLTRPRSARRAGLRRSAGRAPAPRGARCRERAPAPPRGRSAGPGPRRRSLREWGTIARPAQTSWPRDATTRRWRRRRAGPCAPRPRSARRASACPRRPSGRGRRLLQELAPRRARPGRARGGAARRAGPRAAPRGAAQQLVGQVDVPPLPVLHHVAADVGELHGHAEVSGMAQGPRVAHAHHVAHHEPDRARHAVAVEHQLVHGLEAAELHVHLAGLGAAPRRSSAGSAAARRLPGTRSGRGRRWAPPKIRSSSPRMRARDAARVARGRPGPPRRRSGGTRRRPRPRRRGARAGKGCPQGRSSSSAGPGPAGRARARALTGAGPPRSRPSWPWPS